MLTSETKHVSNTRPGSSEYRGMVELTSPGLHAVAFELLTEFIPRGSSVLDLGSGAGAWPTRLQDAGYAVTACDLTTDAPIAGNFTVESEAAFPFPYKRVNLNGEFAEDFNNRFDAVSIIEVIEHLENPRQVMRQIAALLTDGGTVILTTPNASGLYSRLRFFFTGQMAAFTDAGYRDVGHITPLTVWHLDKIFAENGLEVVRRRFFDGRFWPPRSFADLAKIGAWVVFRMFMRGVVGGQIVLYVGRKSA